MATMAKIRLTRQNDPRKMITTKKMMCHGPAVLKTLCNETFKRPQLSNIFLMFLNVITFLNTMRNIVNQTIHGKKQMVCLEFKPGTAELWLRIGQLWKHLDNFYSNICSHCQSALFQYVIVMQQYQNQSTNNFALHIWYVSLILTYLPHFWKWLFLEITFTILLEVPPIHLWPLAMEQVRKIRLVEPTTKSI